MKQAYFLTPFVATGPADYPTYEPLVLQKFGDARCTCEDSPPDAPGVWVVRVRLPEVRMAELIADPDFTLVGAVEDFDP